MPENAPPKILFANSLMESAGQTPPNNKWMMLGSVLLQAVVLAALLIYPLIYPEALPRQTAIRLLVAPPEARGPRQSQPATGQPRPQAAALNLAETAPRLIAAASPTGNDSGPPEPGNLPTDALQSGVQNGMPNIVSATPPPVVRQAPTAPQRVSAGVAAGLLLHPIRVVYPRIAQQARVEGTVSVEATISREGTIDNPRVLDGPILLRDAALRAVSAARYRPFLLSGEPVEVQTTINVVFRLGE